MTSEIQTAFVHLPGAIEQHIIKVLKKYAEASSDNNIPNYWGERLFGKIYQYINEFGASETPVTGTAGVFFTMHGDQTYYPQLTLMNCNLASDDHGN